MKKRSGVPGQSAFGTTPRGCWADRFVGMEKDDRIILRELSIDSPLALVDFEGNRTTHQDYADSRRLRFTPTVLFLDGAGSALAEPLIGVTTIDFYGFYLNRSIAQSIEALNQ